MAEEMYDAMDFGESAGPAEEVEVEEEDDEAEEIDGEFMMLAEKLGFGDPEKAKALKSAIERCVALKEEGEYEAPADEEMLGEDLEL